MDLSELTDEEWVVLVNRVANSGSSRKTWNALQNTVESGDKENLFIFTPKERLKKKE